MAPSTTPPTDLWLSRGAGDGQVCHAFKLHFQQLVQPIRHELVIPVDDKYQKVPGDFTPIDFQGARYWSSQ